MREFGMGVLGLATGGFLVLLGDRYAATHALNASGQDAPAQGQTYNAEAANTPIWMNWKRMIATAIGVILPFGISSWVRGSSAKSFWQLAGFGALGYTGVKVFTDVAVWSPLVNQPMAKRLLAPEIAAKADLNVANVAMLPPISAMTAHTVGTAGLPKGLGQMPQIPAGWVPRAVNSAAECPSGSQFVDAGLDGKWCFTPPASPPPPSPPMTPPPMPPPPGGGGQPPMCPPGPPSPPSMTVCTPQPHGGLTPPWAGASANGACCGSCGSGGPCACEQQAQMAWSDTLAGDHD